MTSPAQTPQTNKTKSPPTPSYSLKEVYQDARTLYDKFSHASFSQAEVASALNMSSTSGSFAQRIFSLTAFGLLDRAGEKYSISKLFHALEPVDNKRPDFQTAALSAVRRATVFAEILNDFKTKLPSKDVVAQRLEKERGFNSARAKEVAGILQRSLEFAGVIDANNNILPVREMGSAAPSTNPGSADIANALLADMPSSSNLGSLRRSEIPLADGRVAVVQYPHDLSTNEAAKIGKVLTAMVD
jgi:hypothetical protein